MPSWGEILGELQRSAPASGGPPDFDGIRRKYLSELSQYQGRNVILYATDWFNKPGPHASIALEDMQGMMEVCRGIHGPALDLILHSPGGSAEATASIVRYLRRKFTEIRIFVPIAAMSAATMWALAGNEIYMGKHSQLGPIDPQLVTVQGQAPARAIIEQFEKAKEEISDKPALLGAWLPILQQYGPALITQCEKAEQLARRLVGECWRRTCSLDEPMRPKGPRRWLIGSRTTTRIHPTPLVSTGTRPERLVSWCEIWRRIRLSRTWS